MLLLLKFAEGEMVGNLFITSVCKGGGLGSCFGGGSYLDVLRGGERAGHSTGGGGGGQQI